MGFTASTRIVEPADVARITFEAVLGTTRLDSGGATVAGLCDEATNAIMRDVARVRGEDPALVSNTTDFTFAAAHWVRWRFFASLPQGDKKENEAKAKESADLFKAEIASIVIKTENTFDQTNASRGLPSVVNINSEPAFNRPRNSARPWSTLTGPYRSDPSKGG